jgi:hypothetical protein
MDFRSSLIAQGRAVYEYAIQDAESLVSLDTGELEEMFEEGYLYAPTKAYEQINGSQPDTGVTRKTEPSGTEWNETRASLQELFPRAWALYGWEEAKSPPLTLKKPWWKSEYRPQAGGLLSDAPSKGALEAACLIRVLLLANVLLHTF